MLVRSFFLDTKRRKIHSVGLILDDSTPVETAATYIGHADGFDLLDCVGGYVSAAREYTGGLPFCTTTFGCETVSDVAEFFECDVSGFRVAGSDISLDSVLEICREGQPCAPFDALDQAA